MLSQLNSPIFIVGCPRSGTTVLASILNRHSQIASSAETHFFNYLRHLKYLKSGLKAQDFTKFVSEVRVKDFCEVGHLQAEDVRKALEQACHHAKLRPVEVFECIIALYLKRKNKARVCEQTAQHLHHVDDLLKFFPSAKIIHIQRDGRDVVNSLMKMPWRPAGLLNNARFWKRNIESGERLSHYSADQVLVLQYEALLNHPEEVLRDICDFVGEDFEPALLEAGTGDEIFSDWEDDWKYKAKQALDPSRIGVWRRELGEEDQVLINFVLGPYLRKLGYEVVETGKMKFSKYFVLFFEYLKLLVAKVFRPLLSLVGL